MSIPELIRRRSAMAAGSDGMTLVELLVAVVILGLAGTAIAGMFIVMTSTTFLHREQANVGAVLRSAAEAVNSGTYVCTNSTNAYNAALFSVPVTLSGTTMTVGISPSPFNAGAVGDFVADSGGSGSPAIPAGTTITSVSADGSTVTLSAAASGSPAGDAVIFYPPVVQAPTVISVTALDGTSTVSCGAGATPLELVTVQVQSAEHRVSQNLTVVKGPAL